MVRGPEFDTSDMEVKYDLVLSKIKSEHLESLHSQVNASQNTLLKISVQPMVSNPAKCPIMHCTHAHRRLKRQAIFFFLSWKTLLSVSVCVNELTYIYFSDFLPTGNLYKATAMMSMAAKF